jgi:hypothetical protein
MARNNGLEPTVVFAGDLDSSQRLVLKVGSVVRVAIHRANDARIYASGVRGPDLDLDVIEGSQVLMSTTWMSRCISTPFSPSLRFLRICSP